MATCMEAGETVRLGYAQPYRFADLLRFFGARALQGIELVDESSYARTARVRGEDGDAFGWFRVRDDPQAGSLAVTVSKSLGPVLPHIVARIRRQFDLDCDPAQVQKGLRSLGEMLPAGLWEGTRLPGCFDPFETACRAVIGQQVSVVAANRMAARLVAAHGMPVDTGIDGLGRTWPAPDDALFSGDVEAALGELGIIRSRSRAIAEIACAIVDGRLDLGGDADAEQQMEALMAIKGIGPWTANYVAMRVLGHPDAFLESDVGVAHALPDLAPKERLRLAEAWRPWRSYAVINLWNSLSEE